MPRRYPISLLTLAATLAVQTLGCGSANMNSQGAHGLLQSITVTPAQANAQNSANGQVTFTAMGTFTMPPSPALVTFQPPYSGSWAVNGPGTLVSTGNGTATFQCAAGQSGTALVTAMASNGIGAPAATAVAVMGHAQLICP